MSDYDIQLDVKYPHGTVIDVAAEAAAHEPWFNQTLTQIDDAVVRLGSSRATSTGTSTTTRTSSSSCSRAGC